MPTHSSTALTPYRLIDLFAGCGGMTRGFVDAGAFRPVFAVEIDPDAADTYGVNFSKDHVFVGPIEAVAWFPRADVVIGGPPCQGFSPLNREGVGYDRRGLWAEYVRALKEATPQVFVMENVPELLTSPEYDRFADEAAALGYTLRGEILNAADFGVPQRRRRAIVIGSRSGDPPWPSATHGAPESDSGLPRWRTFADAVVGLPLEPDGQNWHRGRNPRPMSVERYRAVPPDGGNRFQMQSELDRLGKGDLVPRCWRKKPTGTTDVFGRLWWDRPAYTIRTEFYKPEKGRYLHPSEHRPITVREAARCMGFDDDFRLPDTQSMTSIARQVGNAVPPRLARRIAEIVGRHLDAIDAPPRDSPQPQLPIVTVASRQAAATAGPGPARRGL
jgi:DNA (cytosine-5)-methyltransferase 1